MNRQKTFTRTAIAAGLLVACAGANADADVAALQQRLNQMEQEMSALRAELAKVAAQAPVQEQKVAAIETRVAKVETAPAAIAEPKVIGNRVFFRGGAAGLVDSRADGAFTDLMGLGGTGARNTDKNGWYFGGGFDFLLSRDTLGLIPGAWTLAELSVEFRNLGEQQTMMTGPVVGCLALGVAPAACTTLVGRESMTMLTVSASPKIKFMEGSRLRPWIIPAGFDVNVISPPSDSTNYLDVGVQFAAGLDYEVMPGITLGADVRYHLSADLTDPKWSDSQAAAVKALTGGNLNTHAGNDAWTAGISLGIGF